MSALHPQMPHTLKAKGCLIDLSRPIVMGILNVTPDSFYGASRVNTQEAILTRARQIIDEGGTIIDIGAYSSRPGAVDVSEEEEIHRLKMALEVITREMPDAVLSVDTFRSRVSRFVVEEFGVDIINDISGGGMDPEMILTAGRLKVGYVVMHMQGTPQMMQLSPHYNNVISDVTRILAEQIDKLTYAGVTDIIVDPGFGFGKTIEHNYQLLNEMEQLKLLKMPILVGVSRKSMIYKPLNTEPQHALNGTSILNTIALQKGADILRVHDVKEAVECINLLELLKDASHVVSSI